MTAPPRTPLWLKVAASTVLVVGVAWWLHDRADRRENEARLSAVASQIAGRPVDVRCPGPLGRLFGWDIVEGSVAFSADGRPADETRLRKLSCTELDSLAEGERTRELACTERAQILCGGRGAELAMAVDVLSHESWHMQGVRDEAETECRSLQTMAFTAERLGASEPQYLETYPQMGEAYRSGTCVDGGHGDLRPQDARFP
ncbi:MAG: hypothetical protein M3O90_00175 [Actinomycetota bacterium]|nr:hypothetical protein [Actinomycetota bacterium]